MNTMAIMVVITITNSMVIVEDMSLGGSSVVHYLVQASASFSRRGSSSMGFIR